MLKSCLELRGAPSVGAESNAKFERDFTQDMIRRLLYTAEAMHWSCAYSDGESDRRLCASLSDSGFPNFVDFTTVGNDLKDRETMLGDLPSAESLKKGIADNLLIEHNDPQRLLAALSQRSYLEMLDESKLFLPFTMGPVVPWNRAEWQGMRSYVAGWGCIDAQRNCPYLYTVYVDQNFSEVAFENEDENLAEFLKILRFEGSQAPEKLNLLGTALDISLRPLKIHPKVIKRVRIGPLYSPLLMQQRLADGLTETEQLLSDALSVTGQDDDLALLFNEEILFSKGQMTEGFLTKTMREVFYVPQLDDDAEEVGSSRPPDRYILMPHRALQAIRPADADRLLRFNERIKFGYDSKENVHAIG
jgi:hypothetical protein